MQEQKNERNLLKTAELLVMFHRGSYDCTATEAMRMRHKLERKLNDWEPKDDNYDIAVKHLLMEAVQLSNSKME
jgi:hypothetical protein